MVIAHVKWFITDTAQTSQFLFSETAVKIWALIVLILILCAFALDHILRDRKIFWLDWALSVRERWIYFFQLCLAASLIFASANYVVLFPHYNASTWFIPLIEILAAIFLIVNRWVYIAAFLLLLTYISSSLSFGFFAIADYVNVIGMSLFLLLEKLPLELFGRWKIWSLDILRIFTGIALVILSFSEKLAAPEKAISFLADYNLNFMSAFALDYSDRLFVLSAGSMELTFGLIMIFGLIARINTIALAIFILGSNIFFFVQGYYSEGWTELFGHLPIIGSAALLIIYGKSFKNN